MITTDHYYEIGKGHIVNQDYVKTGRFPYDEKAGEICYSIVSDGCSSPKDKTNNNDLASRFLVKTAEQVIKSLAWKRDEDDFKDEVRKCLVHKINAARTSDVFFDCEFAATLIIALYSRNEDKLWVLSYGDGGVFLRSKDSSASKWINFYFSNGAPYYLCYYGNEFDVMYEKKFGREFGELKISDVFDSETNQIIPRPTNCNGNKSFSFKVEGVSKLYSSISVFSDGFETFSAGKDSVPMHLIFEQISNLKLTHGEFMIRRMQAFKRYCEKNGWTHFDDISIGTISL